MFREDIKYFYFGNNFSCIISFFLYMHLTSSSISILKQLQVQHFAYNVSNISSYIPLNIFLLLIV